VALRRLRFDCAARKLVDYLSNDGERLEQFFAAHHHAALHVTLGEDRHGELHLIVEGVREIAPQVVIKAGGAPRNADDAKIARDLRLEHARGFKAISRARMETNQFDEVLEFALEVADELSQGPDLLSVEVEPNTAQARYAAQQTVAGEVVRSGAGRALSAASRACEP
jgi:hypothetical protein